MDSEGRTDWDNELNKKRYMPKMITRKAQQME